MEVEEIAASDVTAASPRKKATKEGKFHLGPSRNAVSEVLTIYSAMKKHMGQGLPTGSK